MRKVKGVRGGGEGRVGQLGRREGAMFEVVRLCIGKLFVSNMQPYHY